ncbi:hypothetical protein BV98_000191 [Sphingobium herbicidovorans NBRC 16415]|uniref:Uncharacterized protein n=1 Tax=Sphingobium herbicidovorans (strain ATCC 700291 / DSM 11019 / CCUG 56400 / KCTC 2939 / LMG 18315 / NBRC 16415 / MH) TaxID=1219045 RepID=A0A086PEX2_SPHHM|nr:hypothetical protein [Sphingobium herbicidovorans]KFG91940.1 hypothetical protein BV98_000191 [Sphingobium herbicidovorans NBRC 16415]
MNAKRREGETRPYRIRQFAIFSVLAATGAMVGSPSLAAAEPLSFALTNIYVPSYDDDKACRSLSLSSSDIFLQSLPPAEREKYESPEKIQELHRLMGSKLGFKMVPTGHASGANGSMATVPEAELDALRQKHDIPKGKGILSFLGTRLAYDSCTNPEDFPFLAKGNEPYLGKVAYGIDLDGRKDRDDFLGVNGEQGVDNELIRATGCNFATRDYGTPKVADEVITSIGSPTLVEISGVDDPLNDDDVTVRIYASANPLEVSGSGKGLAWTSLDVDPEPRFQSQVKGRIRNGELSTEPFDLRVRLREQIVDSYREVRQARIRATIKPGESIEGGIYGYHTLASIEEGYHQSTQVGANLTRMSCPALIKSIRSHADALPDPRSGKNTAISSALRFRGIPAFLIKPGQKVAQGSQQ